MHSTGNNRSVLWEVISRVLNSTWVASALMSNPTAAMLTTLFSTFFHASRASVSHTDHRVKKTQHTLNEVYFTNPGVRDSSVIQPTSEKSTFATDLEDITLFR